MHRIYSPKFWIFRCIALSLHRHSQKAYFPGMAEGGRLSWADIHNHQLQS